MRLAFSTNAYTRFGVEEACRRIAGHGYRGVEILADAPHAYPGRPASACGHGGDGAALDPAGLGTLLTGLGLEVSNVNCNTAFGYWREPPPEPFFEPSLISGDPQLRAERVRLTLAGLDLAAALGAGNISITSGKPLGSMSPERCEPVLEEHLGRILERAEVVGIDVGIECEPGLLIETSDELLAWIERMGSPRLGANLDVGHAVVGGEEPVEVIEKLRGRIWNLHLEDIRGRKHYHRIPGEGDIDFAAVAAALERIGYRRWATLELYTHSADPDRAARESLARLGPVFG